MIFPKYIYQLQKVQSGFFFVLRKGKIYMDFATTLFLGKSLEKFYQRGGRGVGGNKNLDIHSLFQGGGLLQIGLDGCGQKGWGRVKKFALSFGRHKWMTPILQLIVLCFYHYYFHIQYNSYYRNYLLLLV